MKWLESFLSHPGVPGVPPIPPAPWDEVLEALCAGLPPEDALALREERAAILEYEAGFTRDEANRRAGLAS